MEVQRMNGRTVVESGMGQLQVAVAGLGEGGCGRACGQPGQLAPGQLGASGHAGTLRCCRSAGGSRRRCHSRLAGWRGQVPKAIRYRVGWHDRAGAGGTAAWVASKTGET